jgi:hypothetical protein
MSGCGNAFAHSKTGVKATTGPHFTAEITAIIV